ncbi:adenosylcobinamide-phosphate synthase CbiB [Fodinisporobacter ferrooxydans]|uniref:Cobalamin biosynthesis protein CobD n=1 Tax=Fodinisporobacter ferrooxydans TaxID=2901836 RepID=A0ABY4CHN8_9BACL|nr:adenosylcobinamide-phosphate synthase CbiB [Alicyclobacillaceae bacterium MYW30-H2]
MSHIAELAFAYWLDGWIGDPRWMPHPVVWMGKGIALLERIIRRFVKKKSQWKIAGILFPLLLAGGSYGTVWLLLHVLSKFSFWLSWIVGVWLISTTIATKGLADAGLVIYRHLICGDLERARRSLSMVVGRDTEHLNEQEIARGAIETVAENIVDAVIAPLFYGMIGGPPLAMAYRAANTLDSMVGYKNEKYAELGWASARFDDLLNWIPARMAAVAVVFASGCLGFDWRNSWKVMRRDARLHPSPNSGFTEAGMAGALGIQLGGLNFYQGIPSMRAKLGDPLHPLSPLHIQDAVRVMRLTCTLFLIFGLICMFFAMTDFASLAMHLWR